MERNGVATILVPPLELPEVEIGDPDVLEEQVKKIQASAEELRGWFLGKLGELEKAKGMSPKARELVAEKIATIQRKLEEFLCHSVPDYRRAAWLALLTFELGRGLSSRQETEELLSRLVKEKRLVETPGGRLVYGRRSFEVSPASMFEEPEMLQAYQLFGNLLSRVYQEIGRARQQKTQHLTTQATINWQELKAGKRGKCVLDVPAEKVQNGGKEFWRGGGILLVESDGEKIFPLDASGAIEETVREANALGVHLLVKSLTWDEPPFVRGLQPEKGKKVQLLWHLCRRGFSAEEEKEKVKATRQIFSDEADLTPEGFFSGRESGTCLVGFRGIWEVKDPEGKVTDRIPNLFLLVRREEKEGKMRLRIAEVPDHLGDLFRDCMEGYTEEGNKFEGTPHPLRAILMAVYGQVTSQEAIRQITSK